MCDSFRECHSLLCFNSTKELSWCVNLKLYVTFFLFVLFIQFSSAPSALWWGDEALHAGPLPVTCHGAS